MRSLAYTQRYGGIYPVRPCVDRLPVWLVSLAVGFI